MTGAAPTITVREILVMGIMWWVEGRNWAQPHPDLSSRFTGEQLDALYDAVAVAAADRSLGQIHVEAVMEHLAMFGGAYMTADGSIAEDNRPVNSPDIPQRLLETARELYAAAVKGA